ncbi:MAG: Globin-coupled histidine kinase [Chloroflexaceae bacterium]|nr:Globin-coupled histidine kinase [Chloroflexaceae bacterium]
MAEERESWKIKDEAILSELVALMGLSDEEKALLGGLADQARAMAPKMTDMFYDRLLKHQNTQEYLQGLSTERMHSMLGTWFVELFSGTYDEAYTRQRMQIGHIHVRIGLPVRYPLAMLDVIIPFGEEVARQSPRPEQALTAFRKVLALDVAVFNQAYENNQLKHLSELVGGERLARLLLAGKG